MATPRKRVVMLGHRYKPDVHDPTGWWISEKFDGIRGYWDGRRLLTATGLPLAPPTWWTERLPTVALDGELWGGRDLATRQAIKGVARRLDGRGWERVGLCVFDAPEASGGFEDRLALARDVVGRAALAWVQVVEHQRCRGRAHLQRRLRAVEQVGGEGLILRQPGSTYVHARSTAILKVKSWRDTDARVVGYEPGHGRHASRLGALVCELPDGTRFKVGTGLSDELRDAPPPRETIVNVGYFELTASGKPREPFLVEVRS